MSGFGWCILSLLAAVVLGLFDRRAEKILKRKQGEGWSTVSVTCSVSQGRREVGKSRSVREGRRESVSGCVVSEERKVYFVILYKLPSFFII